jgi:D-arabinose 1-dehydrogenase-like Zn-dependent alcohol dehydrogenase
MPATGAAFVIPAAVSADPAAGQVVVRVQGAGVGPWDVAMISGAFGRLVLPYIPGFEVAGVMEAVGNAVEVRPG